MMGERQTLVGDDLLTLWTAGAIGGAEDAVLITRFSEQRDEAAEAAFRVLVERHGPMVVRVCRQVIGDRHAAEEAAQAVFLVLARKAGSLRVRTTVAPWLYGVARRVAARARVRAATRRAREERTVSVVAAALCDADTTESPHEGDWEEVHQEIDRLPEKYRTPVVLCYLEGQSYEEAARRIGCPVGTIRVRLSRARDRLRDSLTRRGFGTGPVAAVGSLTHGTVPARLATSRVAARWVDATVKAVQAYVAGRAAAAGVVPALALALGDEVVRALAMSQWKMVMFTLAALGATSAAAVGLGGVGGSQDRPTQGRGNATGAAAQASPEKKAEVPAVKELPEPVEVMVPKQQERRRVAAAQRVDAQSAFYREGRITIDRYIEALQQFHAAQMEQAKTREQRIIAAQAHMKRIGEVLKLEQDELEAGRGTVADVAEAMLAHELAAIEVLEAHKPPALGDMETLQKRVETLEKQLDRVLKHLERTGNSIR
jgi:RNA polymerase sigma factor (sigma-70 family)